MRPFQARLLECMEAGALSYGDLHHWFERPRPTVRYWLNSVNPMVEPWKGPRGADTWRRLRLLEWAIEKKLGFPISTALSARDRPRYVTAVYAKAIQRIPAARLARDRVESSLHPA